MIWGEAIARTGAGMRLGNPAPRAIAPNKQAAARLAAINSLATRSFGTTTRRQGCSTNFHDTKPNAQDSTIRTIFSHNVIGAKLV